MTGRAIEIADGIARATILPSQGGAIGLYDLIDADLPFSLFRQGADQGRSGPFAAGCNVLVPWSNRIAGGGFMVGDRFVALSANVAGEPCPIHGNGFQARWSVGHRAPDRLQLRLHSEGPGFFRYDATLDYRLEHGALVMVLAMTNRSRQPLPYGGGFHPWLPRTRDVMVQARADRVWLEDERHLPVRHDPVDAHPAWDFRAAKKLPTDWLNQAYVGWDGRARVLWPKAGVALDVEADAGLRSLVIYSPSGDAPFFCLEPVSHPVDAHNRRGDPAMAGLVDLMRGETLTLSCRFVPSRT